MGSDWRPSRLARAAGLEVFATAGSGEKREFLKSLGVPHVMDSRTLAFADEILEKTGGAGVDIVLNSLNRDFIPASLSILQERGRFVEIGRRGIWKREPGGPVASQTSAIPWSIWRTCAATIQPESAPFYGRFGGDPKGRTKTLADARVSSCGRG